MAGQHIFGVMIGRAAYNTPWHCLADADRAVFGAASNPATSRRQVLRDYAAYGDAVLGKFTNADTAAKHPNVRTVVKPILGLFHGAKGGKRFRNRLDSWLNQHAKRDDATVSEAIAYAIEVRWWCGGCRSHTFVTGAARRGARLAATHCRGQRPDLWV